MTNPSDASVITERIQALFGHTPTHFEQIHSGNSRVYKVSAADQAWIAKLYPDMQKDPRDRLGTEFGALTFLWQHGQRNIPQPLHAWPEKHLGIYTYIKGIRPNTQNVPTQNLETAIAFLKTLYNLSKTAHTHSLPAASEACFSINDYFDSIQKRLQRLDALQPQTPYHQQARYFLDEKFMPFLQKVIQIAQTLAQNHNIVPHIPLPQNHRTLSPSDFGFHNAIQQKNGQLIFLDFEYFGWDDPAKMIADFLHHPAMALSDAQRTHFKTQMRHLFQADAQLPIRLQIANLAFGLKWCLILLNEFLPDMLQRRIQANNTYPLEERLNRQLQKAQDKYHDTFIQYCRIANA